MELDGVQSDLQALRKLYGLLQISEDGVQNAENKILDERARLLLKNLLDGATERVLETHPKIIATQSSLRSTPSSKPEQPKAVPKPQTAVSPNVLQASASAIRNLNKDLTYYTFTSQKGEMSTNKPIPRGVFSESSRQSICSSTIENRKKRCRVCKQRSIKQQISGKILSKYGNHQGLQQHYPASPFHPAKKSLNVKAAKSNEKLGMCKSFCGIQRSPGVVMSSVPYSSSSMATLEEAAGDFSKEVDKSIKRIESGISTLELCSSGSGAANDSGLCMMANSVTPIIGTKEGAVGMRQLSHAGDSALELQGNELLRQHTSQIASQKGEFSLWETSNSRNQISKRGSGNGSIPGGRDSASQRTGLVHGQKVKGTESLNRVASQIDHIPRQTRQFVRGLRVPPSHDDMAMPFEKPTQLFTPIDNQTARTEMIRKAVKSRPLISPPSAVPNKNSPRRKIIRPTLLDDEDQRSRTHKNGHVDPRKKILPPHDESEETETTSSGSQSFASWTTHKTSTSGSSDSEAYSLPRRTRAHQRLSPTPRRPAHVSLESGSSSEESSSSYSLPAHYMNMGPTPPRRLGTIKTQRSSHLASPEKAIGRLKRLKNKLGLIFHHHHHHHHHHHYHDNSNESDHTERARTGSTWKHLQKIFHHENKKHEGYGKHAVEKSRKSTVSKVPRKQQVGHFHALVEGLRRHVRHSKESKPSKDSGIRRSGNGPRGRNKKLHWWQMMQRHGGVKLPKRGRVKLRLTRKKAHSLGRTTKMSF